MSASLPVLSRRALLATGAAGGLAALTACEAPGDGRADALPAAEASPSLAPDVALATLALAEIRAVRRAVETTRRAFPARTAGLRAVASMHRSHEAALADAVPDGAQTALTPPAYDVPARAARASRRLRQREEQLRRRLDALALDAESGAFASLLASMGAGVAQRVATWPTT
ncbi:hypothetical protein [Nocardioides aequoreus]|uniref:hypothetical protein n=1 Tax=Nocardioides aequoreus TaxID=397278 RepID=UPI0004C2D52F|nr:hypothetical protein [Nocardioides aequoreus]